MAVLDYDELIYSYSRAQALVDGMLVDVTQMAFVIPMPSPPTYTPTSLPTNANNPWARAMMAGSGMCCLWLPSLPGDWGERLEELEGVGVHPGCYSQ